MQLDFRRSIERLDNAAKVGLEKFKETARGHHEESILRRKTIIKNLKALCKENHITRKELKGKMLKQLMTENSDKFFGLKSANGMISTYFFGMIETLKDSVFGVENESSY